MVAKLLYLPTIFMHTHNITLSACDLLPKDVSGDGDTLLSKFIMMDKLISGSRNVNNQH